jgi:methyl-accepting chemotaxis protein
MSDSTIQNVPPHDIASELGHLFEEASRQQRELWEQAGRYSKDESLRFATLRLKRTNQALEDLHGQNSFKDMVSAHQTWLHDLVEDYAAQSIRLSQMFGSLSSRAMALAADAGKQALENGHEALEQGQAAARENAETVREAGEKVMRANHEAIKGNMESIAQPAQEYH